MELQKKKFVLNPENQIKNLTFGVYYVYSSSTKIFCKIYLKDLLGHFLFILSDAFGCPFFKCS